MYFKVSKWFIKPKVFVAYWLQKCKSAKYVIEKDVENIASKHIFARWQAILSVFYFDIEYIKGSQNTTITNVGGIGLNNLESIDSRNT